MPIISHSVLENRGGLRKKPPPSQASFFYLDLSRPRPDHACQRRREDASAGRSKTASGWDAKGLHRRAFVGDKQDEKRIASPENVTQASSVASPPMFRLPH